MEAGLSIHITETSRNSTISLRKLLPEVLGSFTLLNIELLVSAFFIITSVEAKVAIKAIQKKRVKDYLTFQNEIKLLRILVTLLSLYSV